MLIDTSTPLLNSVFNPKDFVQHFCSHLSQVTLPPLCIVSIVPHLDRYITVSDYQQQSFIFNTNYFIINNPVEHVVFYAGMGAPLAGMSLEIGIELGIEKILIIGTCGLLNIQIQSGDLVVPTNFIREEGVSLHYPSPSDTTESNALFNQLIKKYLQTHKLPFHSGLHWTTDAPFRETPKKIIRYKRQGCISVDMETSALFSVAHYYQKSIGAVLIGSDHLSENEWIPPQPSFRIVTNRLKQIFKLAPEILKDL